MARRRENESGAQTSARHTATKRERVTRAELRERRKAEELEIEQREPRARISLRERMGLWGESLRDGAQVHKRALFVILALVLTVAMLYGPVRGYYVSVRTNQELQAYYDALVEQNEELRSDLSRLQTREGIEDEAHKRGLIYDGEKIVQIEGLTGEVSSPMPDVQVEDCRPWYTKVLDFIFGYEFGVWQ